MNIIDVFNSFQTQEQAVEYLEQVRWKGKPECPYCHSKRVGRHAGGDERRGAARWQCYDCTRAFAVTVGTIFHGTHIPLRNWFLCIALMLNAKKSASAYQIARDLGMRRPTVWSMMHRVRVAMANDPEQSSLLHGIVEADETYIGANRRGRRSDGKPRKRGRGTDKKPVIGVMERGGRVVARPASPGEISTKGLSKFIEKHVEKAGTLLITDENRAYRRVGETMLHATIHHAVEYVNGIVHTNSIEGFWGLVKRAWYGSHHFYSEKYMNLYIAEACYKFNRRSGKAPIFGEAVALFANAK
jgi:transposase-like protein